MLPLTDLLDAIVEAKGGAVEKFREVETNQTIDALTWATGSDNRELRLNASRILYKVVGDDNLCVILHRLRDPKLGVSGQINLLQIAGANTASRENLQAAKETAERLKTSAEGNRDLVNLLDQIASARESAANCCLPRVIARVINVDSGLAEAAPGTPPAVLSP